MIKNFSSFNYSSTVNQAVNIVKAGLESVSPEALLNNSVQYNKKLKQLTVNGQIYDLDYADRIFVIGIGSATRIAASFFKTILEGINPKIIVLDPEAESSANEGVYVVTHHPTASNAEATSKLLNHGPFSEDDLIIAITDSSANNIINAGSTMPPDQQNIVLQTLAELGATTEELETVGVHLAEGRGGKLAALLQPAKIINYVITNKLDTAGVPVMDSPFVSHNSSLYEAKEIVERFDILVKCNLEVCEFVTTEVVKKLTTPVEVVLLASPLTWVETMKLTAKEFGLAPQIFVTQSLRFRDDAVWRENNKESHCLLSLFPVFNPASELGVYEDFIGTELYLASGVLGRTAGRILDSSKGDSEQEIFTEFPTVNVGAVGLRLT